MRMCRGVTLIELMVTISIAAVFLMIAVPSFLEFVQNARRDSQVADIVTSLNYARSEAIKRGVRVTVCPPATGNGGCSGGTNWDGGWIVFTDANSDGDIDTGEQLLRIHEDLGGNTLRGGRTRITYQPTGFTPGLNDTLRLCDSRGTSKGRSIVISLQGRVTVPADTAPASCP